MTRARAQEIEAAYNAIESDDPDISTEQLLARTADTAACSIEDVCEALSQERLEAWAERREGPASRRVSDRGIFYRSNTHPDDTLEIGRTGSQDRRGGR